MDENLFNELLESVRQAGQIRRGKINPGRTFDFAPPDIKALRERHGLSQSRFAALLDVKVATVQNWEQGRRKPHGPALTLLRVFQKDPKTVLEALHA